MAATTEHEKIELSEQTPLKSDTDAPATNDPPAEGTATAEANAAHGEADKSKKGGFKLFNFGKGNKQAKGEEAKESNAKQGAETATEEKKKEGEEKEHSNDAKKKDKKSSWWNRNCQKICHNDPAHPDNAHAQQGQLTYGVNLIQRDDHGLHTAVDFGFEDIYGEPDSAHSWAGVWKANHCIFLAVRSFFYKLFSAILVLPLAIIFGILFALASVLSVFVCVPVGRLISIPANYVFKAWHYVISSVFDPIFHAIGQCFTNVRISRYGINTDPTTVLTA